MTEEKKRIEGEKQTADASRAPEAQREVSSGGLQGGTGMADDPDAKEPWQRDQSPGNAADAPRGEGQKAYEDARRGIPDTTKADAMDATYHRVRQDDKK